MMGTLGCFDEGCRRAVEWLLSRLYIPLVIVYCMELLGGVEHYTVIRKLR